MARARNIKPGFFKNELLGQADPLLSLLFVGLWTLADRRGVLEDRPLRIKAELFPYRDVTDISGYLTELERLGFLERFTAKGVALIHIQNFTKHQSPHPTEKPNEFPGVEQKDEQKQAVERLPVITPLHNGTVHVAAALNPYSLNPESLLTDSLIPSSLKPDSKPLHPAKPVAPTNEVWAGYSKAYFNRYGTEPVRNAKVNGILSNFIQRIPADEAPHVAAFYVGNNSQFYVTKMHPVDLLLADAEKLRTEWVTRKQVTQTAARQADKTQASGDVWQRLIDKQEAINANA